MNQNLQDSGERSYTSSGAEIFAAVWSLLAVCSRLSDRNLPQKNVAHRLARSGGFHYHKCDATPTRSVTRLCQNEISEGDFPHACSRLHLQSTPHQCVSLSEFRGAPAVLIRKQKMFSHFLRAKRTDRKRMHRELAGSERFSSEAQMSL